MTWSPSGCPANRRNRRPSLPGQALSRTRSYRNTDLPAEDCPILPGITEAALRETGRWRSNRRPHDSRPDALAVARIVIATAPVENARHKFPRAADGEVGGCGQGRAGAGTRAGTGTGTGTGMVQGTGAGASVPRLARLVVGREVEQEQEPEHWPGGKRLQEGSPSRS